MKDLAGKVAVITGGGSGIGKELAIQLTKKGMKVVIASTNDEKLQAGVEHIKKAGGKDVIAVKTDVSKRDQVVNLHDQAVKAFGPVDLLVCNAGVTTSGPCRYLHIGMKTVTNVSQMINTESRTGLGFMMLFCTALRSVSRSSTPKW